MYRRIETNNNMCGLYFEGKYMCYTLRDTNFRLFISDISNKEEIVFLSEEERVNRYHIEGDSLVYMYVNGNSTCFVDLSTGKKNKVDKVLYDLLNSCYANDESRVSKYDLFAGNVIQTFEKKMIGFVELNLTFFLITVEDTLLFNYSQHDLSLLWQQDLKSFYADDFDIQIKQVHQYKDTLIVVVKEGIVCLSLEEGLVIWRTENYALTLEVVGDFGYVCTGGSLYRIELGTGLMYNYDREYGRLPDFDYEGKSYWAAGYRVVYHDGLLWYAVYSSGDSFIISIDPLDGTYKWIHKVDTFEKVMELQFHADKMFVSDSGGDLFIYQKEV